MTRPAVLADPLPVTLLDLGWSDFFSDQIDGAQIDGDAPGVVGRLTSVARNKVFALTENGPVCVLPPSDLPTTGFAVGDWVILDAAKTHVAQRLKPRTTLSRRAAGTGAETQLIATNVDTLAIVTSCNADFNEARLERYLTLAAAAGCLPLVVLTKSDLADDPCSFLRRAERLSPLVTALTLNATNIDDAEALAPWCKAGQTMALVGSSGVGKSTLSNALTNVHSETQDVREGDNKGRHTTTAREMFRTRFGGWLIDTPGMRALRLVDASIGIEAVFADIETLALSCRFSDCAHQTEPGCAVSGAIASGDLLLDRVERWRKLRREDAHNGATLHQARSRDRNFGKLVRSAVKAKHKRKR